MGVNTEKGWLSIPGIREYADRTIAEQMLGLDRALAEAKGKTVLDLGCAEAAIGLEFAKAGATRVLGIELLKSHLKVAKKYCEGWPQMEFVCAHLGDYIRKNKKHEQFDIVLALGIIHKLDDPKIPIIWAAQSCRDLLCFRAPSEKIPDGSGDYLIKSKHTSVVCNVPKEMRAQGFVDEGTIEGARGESVQYWRRKA